MFENFKIRTSNIHKCTVKAMIFSSAAKLQKCKVTKMIDNVNSVHFLGVRLIAAIIMPLD